MGSQVKYFERHFNAQARGLIPYSPGFNVVGKLPSPTRKVPASEPSPSMASVSPAIAAVEQAAGLVEMASPNAITEDLNKPAKERADEDIGRVREE